MWPMSRAWVILLSAALAPLVAAAGAENRWIRLKSANFELYSSANARTARDTVREFEQVRGLFSQVFGGPPADPTPVRLVAFGSTNEYEPYRFNEFAIAYYHQIQDRDYIVMSRGGSDTFPVAVHEYVHLLVRHAGLKPPPWLGEGLAELYSTVRPYAGKILIGDLIPGRHRALLEDKWVPLAVILAANQSSPYYNEKNKAGSLYNEGWALTHMLYFAPEYRGKFGELLSATSKGEDSIQALERIYGRPLERIEKDLRGYLGGNTFQGALVEARLEKQAAELPAEPLADFDRDLMFADLLYRPGKEAEYQAALERLTKVDPKRPEPYRELGYAKWRAGRREEAVEKFAMAFEYGDRTPRMLWDYGRLAEQAHSEEALKVLSELLKIDSARMDVRLEVAEIQLRGGQPKAALATMAPIHVVSPADSERFFRIAVHAYLRMGEQKKALEAATHFRDIAKTGRDRDAAELLVSEAKAPEARVEHVGPELTAGERPRIRRAELAPRQTEEAPPPAPRPTVSGRFVSLECQGGQARMILETAAGRKVFLISDPSHVAITAGSSGPVELSCGPQKTPVTVEVGYDRMQAEQAGVDGVVRTLAF